ncbi:MAG: type II toxin-antitoxin system VapC family toxin [Acetivibrionales bacterium]|jgi:tRNA(fMet)-specific endonuclease VapC
MKQKLLFDTSVWIEYFKNNSDVVSFVEKHLLEDSVYLVGIIVSELIQGIKNDKEREIIRSSIDAINFIDMKFGDWIRTGDLSNTLRKSGITIPLTDIAIAAAAIGNDLVLVTRDRHFSQIPGLSIMNL